MQHAGYERFALLSNPFHDLASESLQESEVFHVTQEADDEFERMKQEVLERSRKGFVLISGPLGAGKTQRLRVTEAQARQADGFALYMHLGEAPPDPLAAVAERLVEGAAARKLGRGLSPPAWLRDCKALAAGKPMTPDKAGHTLAQGLGMLAPAYLLLNDLDSLRAPDVRARMLQALLAMVSLMPAGVMVVVACPDAQAARLQAEAPALFSRLNRAMQLRGLGDEEAELVLAKRMAGKRLIDELDPLYPFTAPAVAALNQAAGGSPRRLLQLADLVLDAAVKDRAFQVGPELVQSILAKAPRSAQPATALAAPLPVPAAVPAQPVRAVAVQPLPAASPPPAAKALPPPAPPATAQKATSATAAALVRAMAPKPAPAPAATVPSAPAPAGRPNGAAPAGPVQGPSGGVPAATGAADATVPKPGAKPPASPAAAAPRPVPQHVGSKPSRRK